MSENLPSAKTIEHRLSLAAAGSNLTGALLTVIFFNNFFGADGTEEKLSQEPLTWILIAGLFGGAMFFSWHPLRPHFKWLRQRCAGLEQPPAPPAVCQLALNQPLFSALYTLSIWFLAGIFFALLNVRIQELDRENLLASLQILFGTTLIAGLPTAIIQFFLTEHFWRPQIPLFFGPADPIDTPAFRLGLRWRMTLLFLTTFMPLALLAFFLLGSLQQAGLDRLVGLVLFLLAAGLGVAMLLALSVGGDLVGQTQRLAENLQQIEHGDLARRIPVVSNDEFGRLSSAFNHMADGLQEREDELQALYRISRDLYASLDLDETLQAILVQAKQIIAYDGAEICLYHPQDNLLHVRAWARSGETVTDTRGKTYVMGEGFTGWLAKNRSTLLIGDLDAPGELHPSSRNLAGGSKINAFLGVPLLAQDQIVGTLQLISLSKNAFSPRDAQLLETIAPQAALAIANAERVLQRERMLQAEIAALKIEVNQSHQSKQVQEITSSEYFQSLQERVKELRRKR